jgi:hypothetical protein
MPIDFSTTTTPLGFTPTLPPVFGVELHGNLLKKSPSSIFADRCRAPEKLQPSYLKPGSKSPNWILADVIPWLCSHPDAHQKNDKMVLLARRLCAPTKAERIARQRVAAAQLGGERV